MACGTIGQLASLALTTGGAVANGVANSNIRGKMNNLVGQELARNQGFQKQASNVFNQSFANSTPAAAQQQIGQGQRHLAGLIGNAQTVPITTSLPSISGTNDRDVSARTQMSNKETSNFGGYSNYGLQQYLKNLDTNANLGLIGNQAQQWANILPTQLQQAQQSQGGLQTLGSLLGTAGMLTGIGSAVSAPVGAASNATALTGNQLAGLGGSFGPIGAGYANTLSNPTLLGNGFLGSFNPSYW